MTVKLLSQEMDQKIRDIFEARLAHPVEIISFSKQDGCHTCEETQLLLHELASTSQKLHITDYDLDSNPDLAHKYNVDLAPTLVIAGREGHELVDYGMRITGLPSGYEFSSLIQDIIMVSNRDSGLSPQVRQKISRLSKPVQLKVFVTPT